MFGLSFVATSSSGGSVVYDADAQTYFDAVSTAGGSLGATFKDAYNTFVLAGKSEGWYSGLMQFNPCAGGNEASCEINAISPATLDDTYVNSPTIDATIGVTFDGTTQYADTGIAVNDFALKYDWQIGAYHISGFNYVSGSPTILGAMFQSTTRVMLQAENASFHTPAIYSNGSTSVNAAAASALSDGEMIIGARYTTTDLKIKVNGVSVTNTSGVSPTAIAYDFTFGARNKKGVIDNHVNGKWACKFIAEGLTSDETDDLSAATVILMAAMGL
jgi:hypothetical protein